MTVREEAFGQEQGLSPAMQRIIALLKARNPLSPKEIARDAFIALTTLEGGGYLKSMKQRGLIRVQGWLKNHNGFTTPLYGLGEGPDCPRPKFQKKDRDSNCMAKIIAVLKCRGNLDYKEIAALAGTSANTIKNGKYMDSLLEQRRVHVSAWRRGANGHVKPLYSSGEGNNAPRPKLLTRSEISHRHRQRQKLASGYSYSLGGQFKQLANVSAA